MRDVSPILPAPDLPGAKIVYRFPDLHPGQREILQKDARFKVLACGRRWGKTRLGCLMTLASALEGGSSWWVAPTYKQAEIGWRMLRWLLRHVIGVQWRHSDRLAELPNGGWLQVRSADDPDSLRGEGLDRLVVDECALVSERAWTECLRPTLTDRRGGALFISTPRGLDWFWRLWELGRAGDDADWASWRFPSAANPFLDAEEIEKARQILPDRVFRQEYMAEFLEDAGGVFLGVQAVIDQGRSENESPKLGSRYVGGVDLARVADYHVTTIFDTSGRQVYWHRINQVSWERQIGSIIAASRAYNCAMVVDSTGVGDPIVEQLRRVGAPIVGFPISHTSKEPLIDRLAMSIEQGRVRLMDIPEQTRELRAYQYAMTARRHVTMSAPDGMYDDCVIALALAIHQLRGPSGPVPAVGLGMARSAVAVERA